MSRRGTGSWAPPTPAGVADPGPQVFFREAEAFMQMQCDCAARETKKKGDRGIAPDGARGDSPAVTELPS
jgi:hypothetical protein